MNECQPSLMARQSAQPARKRGRRKHERTRLVYRLVHVGHGSDQGLARCRNISDAGMKLDLAMRVTIGDRVAVTFSPAHVLAGTVVWSRKGECGLAFDAAIDSDAMLRDSAAETRTLGTPILRFDNDLPATLRCDGLIRHARVRELTQHAVQLIHDGDVYPDARLSVALGADKERRGVVRWTKAEVAEIVLLEPFSVSELGSLNALAVA